jgi:hypothetical protein
MTFSAVQCDLGIERYLSGLHVKYPAKPTSASRRRGRRKEKNLINKDWNMKVLMCDICSYGFDEIIEMRGSQFLRSLCLHLLKILYDI